MKGERRKEAEAGRQGQRERCAGGLRLAPASLALCLALLGSPAPAQPIADPTRPPEGFAAEDPTAAEAGAPVLQSVLLSPTRKAAIINGRLVRLGEKWGDAVLVRVSENEAVLKSGEAIQVLKLHPRVEKRASEPEAPAGEARARGRSPR
jgi:MSHA biogenesis protein MshK